MNEYLSHDSGGDSQQRKYRHDDQRELPAVDERVDQASNERHEEEHEHSNLLSNAFLELVQVSEDNTRAYE